MKLKRWCGGIGFPIALLVLAVGLFSVSARAAFLYKSYIVRQAGDQEILCDPYIVQKDDYVLKIFRQRGEISNADFPEFLNIFKLINPQVEDIDKVLPGQRIFIPLKKLEPGSVPAQESGVVTIPFVTKTDISDILKDHADAHEVKPGDTVSKLLAANFGRYGTEAYNEGLSLFKALNPQVADLNLILVGEELLVPRTSLRNELWYESLFDAGGDVAMSPPAETEKVPEEKIPEEKIPEEKAPEEKVPEETVPEETAASTEEAPEGTITGEVTAEPSAPTITALAEAAGLLDARLYQKGTYYFPRSGQSDLQLDLTWFPVLETRDGARVLTTSSGDGSILTADAISVLKNFWKDLVVVDIPRSASLSRVMDALMGSLAGGSVSEKRTLTDGGVQVTLQPRWLLDEAGPESGSLAITPIDGIAEKSPQPVIDYLKTLGVELKEVVLSAPSDETDPAEKKAVFFGQVPVLDASVDRQAFVRNIFGILGMNYQQNATVSFEYAGIQIKAVTNVLNRPDGRMVLVDFESLQQEAVATLEKAGFEVVRLPSRGPVADLMADLLGAVGMTCETDPTFTAARRTGADNITIFIPGFLAMKDETPQALLATVPVHDDLIRFFKEREIDVVVLTNVPKAP